MKKTFEIHDPRSTLNKSGHDEMLFILRAQDDSAPKTIINWISENLHASDEKLIEAFECALEMRHHKNTKASD